VEQYLRASVVEESTKKKDGCSPQLFNGRIISTVMEDNKNIDLRRHEFLPDMP
jgi:hypothetical protein